MNKYSREKEQFYRELEEYRSTALAYFDILQENSMLQKQLTFWMESAKYYIFQLDVWKRSRDAERYKEAVQRAGECLDQVRALLIQLTQLSGEDDHEVDDDD